MSEKSFFKTKEGGMTIAFLVVMAAFVLIMIGLSSGSSVPGVIGFVMIIAAMLYSPVRVYLFDKRKK
jgi:hypothetical protein